MKNIISYVIIIFVLIILGCDEDNSTPDIPDYVGTWALTEDLGSDWEKSVLIVNENTFEIFEQYSTISNSGPWIDEYKERGGFIVEGNMVTVNINQTWEPDFFGDENWHDLFGILQTLNYEVSGNISILTGIADGYWLDAGDVIIMNRENTND